MLREAGEGLWLVCEITLADGSTTGEGKTFNMIIIFWSNKGEDRILNGGGGGGERILNRRSKRG